MKKVSLSFFLLLCCAFFILSCKKSEETPPPSNQQPTTPSSPIPSDAEINISITPVLSWTCSDPDAGDSLKYDIYFGSINPPNTLLVSNWKQPNYALTTLDFNKTYYWRVTAHDLKGASAVGPIWRFTTLSELPFQGLIAYYPFNGNANDESGNGSNATVYGASLTSDRFNKLNKAYYFNGSSDYIRRDVSNHPTGNVTITYSAWIYYSSGLTIGQHASVVDVGQAGDNYQNKRSAMLIWKNTDNFDYMTYCTQGNDFAFLNYQIPLNSWLHVVITKDLQTVKMYINGSFVQQGSINASQNVQDTKITIGASSNFSHENGSPFKGKIDDVRIYNRLLTDSEILQLYHEGGWTK